MIRKFTLLLLILAGTTKLFAQCNPATPSVINITNDSVTLAWTAVSGALGYEYVVLPNSAPQPTSGTSLTALTVGVSGLQYQAYKAWLRSDCGSSVFSNWSYVTFNVVCGAPSISFNNVRDTSIDVSWSAIGGTATYEYVIDQSPADPAGAGTPISTNQVHFGSLNGGFTYYIHIRTQCNSTTFSSWSTQSFVTQFPVGISNAGSAQVRVYPNPVTDKLNIELQEKAELVILNAVGAVVYKTAADAGANTIDLTSYAPGLYMLRLSNSKGIKTTRINKL